MTIKMPPLSDESVPMKDVESVLEICTSTAAHDCVAQSPQPVNGQTVPTADMSRLYRQMELKLESVVERLLLSKVDENDNVLASMQVVLERIFVGSAMRMSQGNISRAARLLGINRNTLSKKLRTMAL